MLGEELRRIYQEKNAKILAQEATSLKVRVEELCRKNALNGENVLNLSTQNESRMAVDQLIEFLKAEGLDVEYMEETDLMYIRWDLDAQ